MALVSSRPPKTFLFCQQSLAADDFFIAGISLNEIDSAFSFHIDISLFRFETQYTILTSKELRYHLLTFTIFIIQSQIGAIPVFNR